MGGTLSEPKSSADAWPYPRVDTGLLWVLCVKQSVGKFQKGHLLCLLLQHFVRKFYKYSCRHVLNSLLLYKYVLTYIFKIHQQQQNTRQTHKTYYICTSWSSHAASHENIIYYWLWPTDTISGLLFFLHYFIHLYEWRTMHYNTHIIHTKM